MTTWSSPISTVRLRVPVGRRGAVGETGATPDFDIGTVTTVAPGGPATASITGTAANPILNLGIPEGEQGEQGIQGIQGIQGPAGSLDVGALTQVTPASDDKIVLGDTSDSNTTHYSTVAQVFTAGKSAASESATGVVELATDAETITGTDTARAITPANLQAKVASDTAKGIVELATDAETITGTDTARAVTPANLQAKVASDTVKGIVELAIASEVVTGSDTVRAITPSALNGAQIFGNAPVNSQSAAYPIVAADANKTILHPVADTNNRTFTIPANGSVPFPLGTMITFVNEVNTLTIAITTDTLMLAGAGTTGSRTLAANGMATAVKITTTKWMISGAGLT